MYMNFILCRSSDKRNPTQMQMISAGCRLDQSITTNVIQYSMTYEKSRCILFVDKHVNFHVSGSLMWLYYWTRRRADSNCPVELRQPMWCVGIDFIGKISVCGLSRRWLSPGTANGCVKGWKQLQSQCNGNWDYIELWLIHLTELEKGIKIPITIHGDK